MVTFLKVEFKYEVSFCLSDLLFEFKGKNRNNYPKIIKS